MKGFPPPKVGVDTVIPCQLVWGEFPEKFAMDRHSHPLADCREETSGFIIVTFTLSQFHGALEEFWYTGLAHETRTWQSGFVSLWSRIDQLTEVLYAGYSF